MTLTQLKNAIRKIEIGQSDSLKDEDVVLVLRSDNGDTTRISSGDLKGVKVETIDGDSRVVLQGNIVISKSVTHKVYSSGFFAEPKKKIAQWVKDLPDNIRKIVIKRGDQYEKTPPSSIDAYLKFGAW